MSQGIFPPMFQVFSQYGIYVMKFFKKYKWRYVIIDDRLPCLENGTIVFILLNNCSFLTCLFNNVLKRSMLIAEELTSCGSA